MPTKRKTNQFSKLNRPKKQQMTNSFAVFVAWILILWGSFYFIRKWFWQDYTTSKILPAEAQLVTKISFPSLNLERSVVTTHVENGEWLLVDDAANYVYESARPGENGAIIIYGHNTKDIFADLDGLNFGDTIFIQDTLGKTFYYKVYDKKIVNPGDVKLLTKSTETLIVYTCTGFLDTKRLIIFAQPVFY
ncbi:MAG: sortase [Candidatus Pacebacteria bacterium]|nr:sortase [Candidatus Paceibacterota bacterium]